MTILTKNSVRLTLLRKAKLEAPNLVLIPGGPGMGSGYFRTLAARLEGPHGLYLVDLPGNGSNPLPDSLSLDHWPTYLEDIFDHLSNVILLGHSFGGMMLLMNPKLDKKAQKFILLSTLPKSIFGKEKSSYWEDPEVDSKILAFKKDPSDKKLQDLIVDLAPLYFPPSALKQGTVMLGEDTYSHRAYLYLQKAMLAPYEAQYIPQIPTLILSGLEDIVTPLRYFQEDVRFRKPFISIKGIEGANHFPWIEKLEDTAHAISSFI
jgi:hypothetical protein